MRNKSDEGGMPDLPEAVLLVGSELSNAKVNGLQNICINCIFCSSQRITHIGPLYSIL